MPEFEVYKIQLVCQSIEAISYIPKESLQETGKLDTLGKLVKARTWDELAWE